MKRIKIDIQVTLRCNAGCKNCIKFCNRESITGMDYSDSDMTLDQIVEFCRQVRELNDPDLILGLVVTGGEATLHPHLTEIVQMLQELKDEGLVGVIYIDTNLIQPVPEVLRPYVINSSEPKDNPKRHNCAFVHPSSFDGGNTVTFESCQHYRKPVFVLNYQGLSACCAADGYIRLYGYEHLIHDHLVPDMREIQVGMDDICQHCPFGHEATQPFERDLGCPVSCQYTLEGLENVKAGGSRITKRWPSQMKGVNYGVEE